MYVKGSNSAAFFRTQSANISNNEDINSYISAGGFYYIRSKDELTWFANRSNTGNNTIIGVLGDNIEGVINGEPIGKDEAYPFQGILDGNGFTLKNISIQCSNTDNGLVGVLGTSGVVKNFNIDNAGYANSLMCDKKLNLKHIKEDARDINAGILVGRNYGKIYNINALDMKYFNFYGFVPEVYSVTNKSDDYSWSDGKVRKKFDTSNSNYYYMNHFCVNSPGNVCPYVGYFAEGFYSEDYYTVASLMFKIQNNHAVPTLLSGRGYNDFNTTIPSDKIWNMNTNNRKVLDVEANQLRGFNYYILNDVCFNDAATATSINDFNTYVMGNFYGNWFDSQTLTTTTTSYLFNPNDKTIYNMALKMAKQPLYYGLDNKGYYTVGVISNSGLLTNNTNICYNTNIIQDTLGWKSDDTSKEWDNIVCPSAYSMASMRMNPLTRAAYNIGIIAGANYGTIEDVVIKVTAQNTSNFVGFYGTIAGKQANGYINNVNVDVDNQFVWDGEDYSYNVTYKNTPILPQTLKDQFNTIAFTWNNVSCYSASTASNLEYYFSSFYENDESVNTATDRMDDCVTYRLRPIIIAGGVIGGISSYQQGKKKQAMYNYQAKVAEENAKIANKNAATERQTGIEEARLQRMKTLQAVGSQQAAMAANGMDVTQGTSLDIIEDTAAMGELDALQIQTNYERKAQSYEAQANNFNNQASMDVIAGKNAYTAGQIKTVQTGLNGVSKTVGVASKWVGFGS